MIHALTVGSYFGDGSEILPTDYVNLPQHMGTDAWLECISIIENSVAK